MIATELSVLHILSIYLNIYVFLITDAVINSGYIWVKVKVNVNVKFSRYRPICGPEGG